MGIFQSILPCVPKKAALSTHQIIHSPESSITTSPSKGRESPLKFDISHPYPLVPGYRNRQSPIPCRSNTPSPASGSTHNSAGRRIPPTAGLPGSPLGPRRVSSMPQARITERFVTFGQNRMGDWAASMDDTVTLPPGPSHSSNVPIEPGTERQSWKEQPRSLSASPAPYSPPTSFRSLVTHLPSTKTSTGGRSLGTSRRVREGRRRSMMIQEESHGGGGGKKLRKVLRVEGDWEIVRESEVGGTAINGRSDQIDGIIEEDGWEMARR